MARPRKDQDGPSAQERIESACWELMEDPACKINVSTICKRAKVNHNTFYYHYENIDDMADQLFAHNVSTEVTRAVLMVLVDRNQAIEYAATIHDIDMRLSHMCLMARSALTSGRLRMHIIDMWLYLLGVEKAQLTTEEQVSLDFISHGVIGLLSIYEQHQIFEIAPSFFNTPIADGVVGTMKQIAAKSSTKDKDAAR